MSAALLVAALTASFAARTGSRPFDGLAPNESLLAVQLYLVVTAIPLYAVSALLDERRRAVCELARGLQFEALLSELSRSFVRSPSDRIGEAFDVCLRRAGEFFGVDRVAIMQLSRSGTHLLVFRQRVAAGVPLLPDSYSCDMFPLVVERLLSSEEVICESIDDLPKDADQDRASFGKLGLRAAVVMPLVASGNVQGVMSLHMIRSTRSWPEAMLAQIRIVAELLANALGRMRVDDALRSSESMKTAILSSLSSRVAVLDRNGVIIAVNDQWLDPARGDTTFAAVGIGVSYVDVCRRAAAGGDRNAKDALAGVEGVLGGREPSFSFEYRAADREGLWSTMSVTPLQRPEGGAVVSHVDVTPRKRAELEAQKARQDLAHFTRVSTMGELTASLAHQLNQPLTGILANAQAARRILDNGADVTEVREILLDIIDDDRRAGEVIQRMRDLMIKGTSDPVVTDTNEVIRDVAMLMISDTIIRNVPLQLELAAEAPCVRGDRIELQQVVLNLLVNAIEAVTDRPVSERAIVVRSERVDGESVIVSVRDSGMGLNPGTESNIFEPFFTTKSTGMGMGLAIARSIVHSHGGGIWATNNDDRGATFFVRLPLINGSAA